jgi:hypothetical protein
VIPFSGYQEDIYSVSSPERLPGRHARLIEEALVPSEDILHLMICPIWDSSQPPFGIQAPRASHALCLTSTRLLVSRDFHRERVEPTVFSIRREDLIGFEFGEAILMSWLALYTCRGQVIAKEGFYVPRHGSYHIAALLRTWRGDWPCHGRLTARAALAAPDVLQRAGHFHGRLLRPLLRDDDACLRASRRPPVWGARRLWLGFRPAGLAHWGTLLLTERAFFYVWSQPPLGKAAYVFDYNLLCFSASAVSQVERRAERIAGVDCQRLLVTFGGAGGKELEILFPGEQADGAREWEQEMRILAARPS